MQDRSIILQHLDTSEQATATKREQQSDIQGVSVPAPGVREQYAERAALSILRATNFTQCLIQNHIAPQITITDPRGNTLTLYGKDLVNETTWRKFLTGAQLPAPLLCSLVEGTEKITRLYRSWLLTAYTRRYRALAQREHLLWFRSVTRLAVVRRIMETKYRWFISGQPHAFADAWVAQEMGTLMLLDSLTTEIAKAIHHIVKAPKEEASRLLEQLYQVHVANVLSRSQISPTPLPPLPEGASLPPLLLLASEEEQTQSIQHEEDGHD